MKHIVPFEAKWKAYTDQEMCELRKQDAAAARRLKYRTDKYLENPLAYYLPHGLPYRAETISYAEGQIKIPPSNYPPEFTSVIKEVPRQMPMNDGIAFLNDREHLFAMLVAPRKTGKSTAGAIWVAIRTLKCDKHWPIFTEHGVEYHEFDGPTRVVIASFSWTNLRDLWEVYREFLPNYELGVYRRGGKSISFGDGRPKRITMERSKSEYIFLCYSQAQHVWESFKAQILHADEQIPINLLRAWEDGSTTYGDYTPACFTLSGYVLDERPNDTGAAGPLKRELWDGTNTRGKTIGRYYMDIASTPDEIITPKKKQERYDRYVNPSLKRSTKDYRRGMAVYFPGWEEGSGMVFGPDVWQRNLHLIDPLWDDDKTPKPDKATLWRVIDFGETGITCCSWWAVVKLKKGIFAFMYRLLYESNMIVAQAAKKIIQMSHNHQVLIDKDRNELTGNVVEIFEEQVDNIKGEHYITTLLDSRSYASRQQGEHIGDLFIRYGVVVSPASGQVHVKQLEGFKDWLRLDYEKRHPWHKDKDGNNLPTCPRLFIFRRGDYNAAVSEIEGLRLDPNDPSKFHKKDPMHFINTGEYWASDKPDFMGDDEMEMKSRGVSLASPTPFTGY